MSHELTPQAAALAAAMAAAEKASEQSGDYTAALLALALQNAAQAPQGHGCGCQGHGHAPAPQRRSVARPLAIAGGVAVCGCVLTGLFLAVALTAVAVGLSGVVLLFLLREFRKGGRS